MSNMPDSSPNKAGAAKKAAPVLNDDGREGGAKYRQDGKSTDGAPFKNNSDPNDAAVVVDPNASVKPIFDLSQNAED